MGSGRGKSRRVQAGMAATKLRAWNEQRVEQTQEKKRRREEEAPAEFRAMLSRAFGSEFVQEYDAIPEQDTEYLTRKSEELRSKWNHEMVAFGHASTGLNYMAERMESTVKQRDLDEVEIALETVSGKALAAASQYRYWVAYNDYEVRTLASYYPGQVRAEEEELSSAEVEEVTTKLFQELVRSKRFALPKGKKVKDFRFQVMGDDDLPTLRPTTCMGSLAMVNLAMNIDRYFRQVA